MTQKLKRCTSYNAFAEAWIEGTPAFYTGYSALQTDGEKVTMRGKLLAEKVDRYLVVYNHRDKDYASDHLKWFPYYGKYRTQLVYATLGKPDPKHCHALYLTNQLYDALLMHATHLLHPNEDLRELMGVGDV
jgi:hypothetical protein